jgi:hypothetical protein
MTTQMIIRMDSEKRRTLSRLSKAEGKTTSEVVRHLIDTFISEHDISGYIDNLWSRTERIIKQKGFTEKDIDRVIEASREASK